MAHYCVFCEKSFDSFTYLRHHTCKEVSPGCIDTDSEGEKENRIVTQLSVEESEVSSTDSSERMEEDYSNSQYKYTVELNEDSQVNSSPALRKMLQGREEDISKAADGVVSKMTEKSDYVYVLEPDNGLVIDLKCDNQSDEEEKSKVVKTEDNQRETTEDSVNGVMDLSGANKRKRKSNLDSALSNILKTKAVFIDQDSEDKTEESNNEEVQANKVQIVDCKELVNGSDTNGELRAEKVNGHLDNVENMKKENSPMNSAASGIVNDLSIKVEKEDTKGTPKVPVVAASNSNTGSSRKNRRKRSMPVRCEKNEEIGDMKDIMEEYGVQSEIKSTADMKAYPDIKTFAEKPNIDGPIDLTPKTKAVNGRSSADRDDPALPIDLTAGSKMKTEKTVKTERLSLSPENNQPVDLSKPAYSETINEQKSNGRHYEPMSPNNVPIDPIQMRQLFENMYKMQSQFPNHNLVQAQLMQFHALMQNAMLNNGIGLKNSNILKSDKNDNIIKAEPGLPYDQTNNDAQKFGLELMQKHGVMPNGFMPNGLMPGAFPMQFNNMAPSSPFNANQSSQLKNRSVKRRSKAPSVINESSMDSIKQEGSMPLVELGNKSSPDQVVETLQQYFPIVPIDRLPKTQIPEDSNGVKFFVKDNEQIRVLVDSLLQVGVLDLDEQKLHGTEPVFKYICRVCDQTFFHVEHLTKHVKKYHIVKKYQCSECDRSFHDAGNYRQHMRVHDESDIPYECPECKRRFRHKCTLKVHMRIHTGEKPFKCEICSATFKISSGLQTHMRKHTGETPYACEFCDLRFKCQSNLKQHLFQHTQVRPFPCDICGKTYSRKSIRDAHLLTHAKEGLRNEQVKNEHVKNWIDNLPQQTVAVGGGE